MPGGALPPPPTAVHAQAPAPNQPKSAENYGKSYSVAPASNLKLIDTRRYVARKPTSHAYNPQAKSRHTNLLRKRKQAKARAKRKSRR